MMIIGFALCNIKNIKVVKLNYEIARIHNPIVRNIRDLNKFSKDHVWL